MLTKDWGSFLDDSSGKNGYLGVGVGTYLGAYGIVNLGGRS